MADKKYRLDFALSNGTTESVEFTVQQGERGADGVVDVTGAKVGQTIRVTAVDGNGKPTAWEAVDHQPRTHYSEFVEGAVIFPEDTVAWDESTEFVGMLMVSAPLVIGNAYKVKYNGTEYVCEAFNYEGVAPCIGNRARLMSGELDTGEPFAILYMDGMCIMPSIDASAEEEPTAGSAMVSIIEGTEIIQKIPNKFIDKDFRINVTLDVLSGENIIDTEFAEIKRAYAAGKNITLVHNAAGVFEYVYVLSYISDERAAFMSLCGDEGINNTNGILRLAVVGYGNSFSTYTANISMMKVNND